MALEVWKNALQIKDGMLFVTTLIFIFCFSFGLPGAKGDEKKIVTYWNHDTVRTTGQIQNIPLIDLCNDDEGYDIINLGFIYLRPDSITVEVKLGRTCLFSLYSRQKPRACKELADAVRVCQQKDKLVLVSVGEFYNKNVRAHTSLKNLAEVLWNVFLGGTERTYSRPFGEVILDGVNIITEEIYTNTYASVIMQLKEKMRADTEKDYLMTLTPYCTFRDTSAGAYRDSILRTSMQYIDQLYIRFYNRECGIKDYSHFGETLDEWIQYLGALEGSVGRVPRIFIGTPASPKATRSSQYFRYVDELNQLYLDLRDNNLFGGFMLWDAKWDVYNTVNGEKFSRRLLLKLAKTDVDIEGEEEGTPGSSSLNNAAGEPFRQPEQLASPAAAATRPIPLRPTAPVSVQTQEEQQDLAMSNGLINQEGYEGLPLSNPGAANNPSPALSPIQQNNSPYKIPPAPINPEENDDDEVIEEQPNYSLKFPTNQTVPVSSEPEKSANDVTNANFSPSNIAQGDPEGENKGLAIGQPAIEKQKQSELANERLKEQIATGEVTDQNEVLLNQMNDHLKSHLQQQQQEEQRLRQKQEQQEKVIQEQQQIIQAQQHQQQQQELAQGQLQQVMAPNQVMNQQGQTNQQYPQAWPYAPNQLCFHGKLKRKQKKG